MKGTHRDEFCDWIHQDKTFLAWDQEILGSQEDTTNSGTFSKCGLHILSIILSHSFSSMYIVLCISYQILDSAMSIFHNFLLLTIQIVKMTLKFDMAKDLIIQDYGCIFVLRNKVNNCICSILLGYLFLFIIGIIHLILKVPDRE